MRGKRPIYADTYARRHRALIVSILVVALVVIAGGAWWWRHKNPRPSTSRYPFMGVRVDQSLGALNASTLQAGGATFVYLKATQGASFVDDNFATNYARAVGLTVGVYHYFSFDSTPQAQATNFIDHVQGDIGTLPVGIYLTAYTTPPKRLAQKVKTFVALVQQHYACSVVLMGTPKMLARVQAVAPASPRWVISAKRPSNGQFWEYADAKLPHNAAEQTYPSAVFTGTEAAFKQLQ